MQIYFYYEKLRSTKISRLVFYDIVAMIPNQTHSHFPEQKYVA